MDGAERKLPKCSAEPAADDEPLTRRAGTPIGRFAQPTDSFTHGTVVR